MKIKTCVLIILLLTAGGLFAQEAALVRELSGKVEVEAGRGLWEPVKVGERIPLGAVVSTGFNSEAVLDLGASTMRIKPLTRMRLDELVRREGVQETRLNLRVGRVRAEIKAEEGLRHDFQIRSPVSTAAVRGTDFDFDGVNLRVLSGAVALSNAQNRTSRVAAGEQSSTDGVSAPLSGAEAMEKQAAISISASPVEKTPAGPLPSQDRKPGSVTIHWSEPE